MIYPIVKYGQPVLEKRRRRLLNSIRRSCTSWWRTCSNRCTRRKGVGLAAPQIGIGKRMAVIDMTSGEDPAQKLVLINPEIVDRRARRPAKKAA